MYKKAIETVLSIAAERGWNQTELGAVLRESSATISNWKVRGLPAEQLVPTARALGLTVEALVSGDVPERPGALPYVQVLAEETLAHLGRLVAEQRYDDAADEAQVLALALRAAARRAKAST